MALRNPQLKALRKHRVPRGGRTPSSASSCTGRRRRCRRSRRSASTSRRARAAGPTRCARSSSRTGVVRELAAVSRQSGGASNIARCTATVRTRTFADDWVAGTRAVGPRCVGREVRGDRRALRRVRDQAHGRLLPVWPTDVRNPHTSRLVLQARVTWWAGSVKRCAARGLQASASTTPADSTQTVRTPRPIGSRRRDRARARPRGAISAYAERRKCES